VVGFAVSVDRWHIMDELVKRLLLYPLIFKHDAVLFCSNEYDYDSYIKSFKDYLPLANFGSESGGGLKLHV
jgi:hypothetical protein